MNLNWDYVTKDYPEEAYIFKNIEDLIYRTKRCTVDPREALRTIEMILNKKRPVNSLKDNSLKKVYEDDNWTIYERNSNLRIIHFKDGCYIEELSLTPEIMKSKLLDTLKDLPEEIWGIKRSIYE